jgi:hypothetical protein
MKNIAISIITFTLDKFKLILLELFSYIYILLSKSSKLLFKIALNLSLLLIPVIILTHIWQPVESYLVYTSIHYRDKIVNNVATSYGYTIYTPSKPFSIKDKLITEMQVNSVPMQYYPILRALIKHESNDNTMIVSKAGAQGLMQLMPATVKKCKINDAFNQIENMECGVWWFKKMLDSQNGNLERAMVEYNAGVHRMYKTPESNNYVGKVLNTLNDLPLNELAY